MSNQNSKFENTLNEIYLKANPITGTLNEIYKLFSKLKYSILFVSTRPSADPRTFTRDSLEVPIPQVEKPNHKETTHFLSDLEFKFSCAEIPVIC